MPGCGYKFEGSGGGWCWEGGCRITGWAGAVGAVFGYFGYNWFCIF